MMSYCQIYNKGVMLGWCALVLISLQYGQFTNLDMGRKTKMIEKAAKNARKASLSELKTKQAIEAPQQRDDLFSESFHQKLVQFLTLNEEVLTIKQRLQGGDLSDQIKENKIFLAWGLEQAATTIIKDQLKTLEDWIAQQKEQVEQEINKIDKAYEQSRRSLISTKSFSEEEMKDQLAHIQKKAEQKQKICEAYDELLRRSKSVYAQK